MKLIRSSSILLNVLIYSIIIRIILEIIFPCYYGDNFMQTSSFINYIEGNGVSMSYVDGLNLSQVYYDKLNLWPLGFIFMNIPFWYLFKDIQTSVLIYNCLSIILFLWSIYKILNQIKDELSEKSKCLILLFFSIAIMPNRYMGATDLWCLALLFYCLYVSLELISGSLEISKKNYIKIFCISFSILLMVSLRYSYWITVFVFPVSIVLFGLISDKKLLKLGIYSCLLSTLLVAFYIFMHFKYFGNIFPTSLPIQPSLQWESLKLYNSLYFNTLYRDSIVRQFFVKIISTPNVYLIFHLFVHFVGLIIFVLVFKQIIKILNIKSILQLFRAQSYTQKFIIISFVLILANNFTFIYSSLQFGVLNIPELYPLGYAAVAEVRYFAPTLVILYIYLIIAMQNNRINFNAKLLKLLILSGFGFAILVNFIFLFNRFDYPIIKNQPKYIHSTFENKEILTQFKTLKYNTTKLAFLPSPYSDIKDLYMANLTHIPEVKNCNWNSLDFHTKDTASILSFVLDSDTSLVKFNPKIIKKSIKPNIDLIEIKIFPNLAD